MPIYEFKCMDCNEVFEVLSLSSDETVTMECKKCKSPHIERILSVTSYAVGSMEKSPGVSSQTRNCSTGSCTTWDVPGVK